MLELHHLQAVQSQHLWKLCLHCIQTAAVAPVLMVPTAHHLCNAPHGALQNSGSGATGKTPPTPTELWCFGSFLYVFSFCVWCFWCFVLVLQSFQSVPSKNSSFSPANGMPWATNSVPSAWTSGALASSFIAFSTNSPLPSTSLSSLNPAAAVSSPSSPVAAGCWLFAASSFYLCHLCSLINNFCTCCCCIIWPAASFCSCWNSFYLCAVCQVTVRKLACTGLTTNDLCLCTACCSIIWSAACSFCFCSLVSFLCDGLLVVCSWNSLHLCAVCQVTVSKLACTGLTTNDLCLCTACCSIIWSAACSFCFCSLVWFLCDGLLVVCSWNSLHLCAVCQLTVRKLACTGLTTNDLCLCTACCSIIWSAACSFCFCSLVSFLCDGLLVVCSWNSLHLCAVCQLTVRKLACTGLTTNDLCLCTACCSIIWSAACSFCFCSLVSFLCDGLLVVCSWNSLHLCAVCQVTVRKLACTGLTTNDLCLCTACCSIIWSAACSFCFCSLVSFLCELLLVVYSWNSFYLCAVCQVTVRKLACTGLTTNDLCLCTACCSIIWSAACSFCFCSLVSFLCDGLLVVCSWNSFYLCAVCQVTVRKLACTGLTTNDLCLCTACCSIIWSAACSFCFCSWSPFCVTGCWLCAAGTPCISAPSVKWLSGSLLAPAAAASFDLLPAASVSVPWSPFCVSCCWLCTAGTPSISAPSVKWLSGSLLAPASLPMTSVSALPAAASFDLLPAASVSVPWSPFCVRGCCLCTAGTPSISAPSVKWLSGSLLAPASLPMTSVSALPAAASFDLLPAASVSVAPSSVDRFWGISLGGFLLCPWGFAPWLSITALAFMTYCMLFACDRLFQIRGCVGWKGVRSVSFTLSCHPSILYGLLGYFPLCINIFCEVLSLQFIWSHALQHLWGYTSCLQVHVLSQRIVCTLIFAQTRIQCLSHLKQASECGSSCMIFLLGSTQMYGESAYLFRAFSSSPSFRAEAASSWLKPFRCHSNSCAQNQLPAPMKTSREPVGDLNGKIANVVNVKTCFACQSNRFWNTYLDLRPHTHR